MSGVTQQRLLYLLKTRGAMLTQQVAAELQLTTMGARKQLELATSQQLIIYEDRRSGKGRPARWWSLSAAGHARFPDRHGDIIVQLLDHMREQFGDGGIEKVILAREVAMQNSYQAVLATAADDEQRIEALAAIRSEEGYMAQWQRVEDGWDFTEHHCPICAAASRCLTFCRSELQLFQSLFPHLQVQRKTHLLSGGERCVYEFRKNSATTNDAAGSSR